MKAYKLLRIKKDGKLYPLFINKTNSTPLNEWLEAECHPTKGFAVRQGWHCCFQPVAPHLKMELKTGEKRVWVECEVEDWESYDRPESQGGAWILAQRMKLVKILDNPKTCKTCKNFIGGGDWNLCCKNPPKDKVGGCGFLCYENDKACENYIEVK